MQTKDFREQAIYASETRRVEGVLKFFLFIYCLKLKVGDWVERFEEMSRREQLWLLKFSTFIISKNIDKKIFNKGSHLQTKKS